MTGAHNSLVGTWKIISFELAFEDGTTVHPWGPDVRGQVIYTADGYMAGAFMRGDRVRLASEDIMNATSEELAGAMKSYVGYSGRYELRGDRVVHHAEISLLPNWTDTEMIRLVDFQGEVLILSTPPQDLGGKKAIVKLTWRRPGDAK